MKRVTSLICFITGWSACLWFAGDKYALIGPALRRLRSGENLELSGAGGANSGDYSLVGPAIVAVLLVIQSFTMTDAARTLRMTAIVAILGTALDSVLLSGGFYWVAQPMRGGWLCPLWITAMWMSLGLSLHGWLRVLEGRYVAASLLGAVGSLAVHGVAHFLGAVTIAIQPLIALPVLALIGAAALPALVWMVQSPLYRVRTAEAGGLPRSDRPRDEKTDTKDR